MAKSLEQLKKEAAKLQERITLLEQSEGKIADYVVALRNAITKEGFDVALVTKMLNARKSRTARAAKPASKTAASADSKGEKPEVGATYKHTSWPEPFTHKGKRVPNYILDTLGSGKTWAQLRLK